MPFAVDPNSVHSRFEQLDTLCVWDPDTATGRPVRGERFVIGLRDGDHNQIRRVTGDETAPRAKARANARRSRGRGWLSSVVSSRYPGRTRPQRPKDSPSPLMQCNEARLDGGGALPGSGIVTAGAPRRGRDRRRRATADAGPAFWLVCR